jgi:High potential iron-sulfur protein
METHDQQRRIILRGAFITGCALAVPMLFTGCDRNESTNSSETGGSGTGPTPDEATPGGGNTSVQGSSKMSKEQAKYQDRPNGVQECANCMQFVAETNTCKVVEGQVSPGGWCTLWVKKV